jgi:hypothetical protein
MSRASIQYFTGQKRTRNEGVMDKTVKSSVTLSQILPSVINKTAYLGGNVCTRILSNRRQLGPQAETFKQEGYFNYDVQLPNRQELLRSSRNLRRKNALRWTKNTLAASVRGTVFFQPKLGFLQTWNLKKEGSVSFPMVPRTSKADIGS